VGGPPAGDRAATAPRRGCRRRDARSVARLQVLGAAALFSTGGALIKATAFTSWQTACFRSGFATLAILLLAPAARRRWSARTLLVGCAYAATLVLFVQANKLTTSARAIFLQSTAPLHLLLLGPLVLRERVRRADLLLMAALAVGMALMFVGREARYRTAPNPALGDVLALASGLTWALTVTGLRALARRERPAGPEAPGTAVASTAAGNAVACLVCLPFALPVASAGAADWGIVAFLGVVQIGLAYLLLTTGVRHVPALEGVLLLLLEPVLNPVWAWALHGERPGAGSLAGAAVMLIATAVHAATQARSQPAGEAAS
jgi:drug/metabolite transporter (DMT)-like permease